MLIHGKTVLRVNIICKKTQPYFLILVPGYLKSLGMNFVDSMISKNSKELG